MLTQCKCRFLITGAAALLLCSSACFDELPQVIAQDAPKSYTEETLYLPVKIHNSTGKVTELGLPGTFEHAQAITQEWHKNNKDEPYITNEMQVTVRTYQRRPSLPEDRNEASLDRKDNPLSKEKEIKQPTPMELEAEQKKLLKQKQEFEILDEKLGLDVIKKRLLKDIEEKLKALDKQLAAQRTDSTGTTRSGSGLSSSSSGLPNSGSRPASRATPTPESRLASPPKPPVPPRESLAGTKWIGLDGNGARFTIEFHANGTATFLYGRRPVTLRWQKKDGTTWIEGIVGGWQQAEVEESAITTFINGNHHWTLRKQ